MFFLKEMHGNIYLVTFFLSGSLLQAFLYLPTFCLILCTISHARLVLRRFRVRLNGPLLVAEIFAASMTSKFSSQSVDLGTYSVRRSSALRRHSVVTFSSESMANPAPFLALIRCYYGFHLGHS